MGAARSSPAQRRGRARAGARRRARLLDRVVLFNDDWVPYEQRADWLLDADCALSTHDDHLETRFAFRTRLLDCFWAGLPVVCTGGDDLGDVVERDGLGAVEGPGDAGAATALAQALDAGMPPSSPASRRSRRATRGAEVVEPLRRQLAAPPPAPRPHPRSLAPAHAAREAGYTAARLGLNLVGALGLARLDARYASRRVKSRSTGDSRCGSR